MNLQVSPPAEVQFVQLQWRGQPLQLETQWVGNPASTHPVIVFLHEGLGSLAMWKDWPARLCTEFARKQLG